MSRGEVNKGEGVDNKQVSRGGVGCTRERVNKGGNE